MHLKAVYKGTQTCLGCFAPAPAPEDIGSHEPQLSRPSSPRQKKKSNCSTFTCLEPTTSSRSTSGCSCATCDITNFSSCARVWIRSREGAEPTSPPLEGLLGLSGAGRPEETQRREAEPSYRGEAFAPRWLAHDEAPPPLQPSLREMARAMTETRGELRRRRAPAAQRASERGSGEPLQRHEAQAAAVVQHGRVEETLPRDGAKLFGQVNLCLVWQTWFAT